MGIYWKASHCVYDCRYHIVWIIKYRRQALSDRIQKRLKVILEGVCKELYVRVINIGMEEDHVHMYVSIPVTQQIPDIVKRLKGRSSKIIREEFLQYLKQFYYNKNVLWAIGYFIATIGEVNHKTIQKYVLDQGRADIESECNGAQLCVVFPAYAGIS